MTPLFALRLKAPGSATAIAVASTFEFDTPEDKAAFVAHLGIASPDLSAYAPLNNPAFTGNPTAPTQSAGNSSTRLATTAFVAAAITALIGTAPGTLDTLGEISDALNDDANLASTLVASIATKAPIASPTFTGVPAAPTATGGTNTTQIATCAFVTTGLAAKAALASPTFTGTPTAPTATAGTNSTQLATTAFVENAANALGWRVTEQLTPTIDEIIAEGPSITFDVASFQAGSDGSTMTIEFKNGGSTVESITFELDPSDDGGAGGTTTLNSGNLVSAADCAAAMAANINGMTNLDATSDAANLTIYSNATGSNYSIEVSGYGSYADSGVDAVSGTDGTELIELAPAKVGKVALLRDIVVICDSGSTLVEAPIIEVGYDDSGTFRPIAGLAAADPAGAPGIPYRLPAWSIIAGDAGYEGAVLLAYGFSNKALKVRINEGAAYHGDATFRIWATGTYVAGF